MGKSIKVLVVEDSEDDAALLLRALRRGGYDPVYEIVDTLEAMSDALGQQSWDLVISDYSMPRFSGLDALKLLQAKDPDISFILITGQVGEAVAVDAMKAGANDYIMKSNLARLIPAVERELRDTRVRRENRQNELALLESRERYRLIVETANEGIWQVDESDRTTFVNQKMAEMLGYTVDEMMGQTPYAFVDEELREAAEVLMQRAHQGISGQLQCKFRRKDGTELWTIFNGFPIVRDNGTRTGTIGLHVDITERKQAESALRESEEKYRTIFNATGTAGVIVEADTTISLVNREFEALSGYSKEEIEGKKSWTDLFTGDRLDDMVRYHNLRRADPDSAPKQYETAFINRKGDVRDTILTVSMIPGTKQSIAFLLDISGIRQAEKAIKQSEKQFRTLFEEAPVGISIARGGKTLMVNHTYLNMFGYASVAELEGRSLLDQISPRRRNQVEAIAGGRERGKRAPRAYETIGLKKDGSQFPFYVESARVELPDGPATIAFFTDITERTKAAESLAESFARLAKTFEQTVESLSSIVEMRDPYTAGHQVRVAKLARAIASELGMSDEQVEAIRTAALIHDIGKIIVPTEILNKPGKLSALERSFVDAHAQASYEILKKIEFALPIADIVLQHHERLDGSGYPQGLSGDSILKEARVLTVADVVEAMASHRPYRPALPLETALEEISCHRGTLYDADVVDACLGLFSEKGMTLSKLFDNP